jgi:hypothetical protein
MIRDGISPIRPFVFAGSFGIIVGDLQLQHFFVQCLIIRVEKVGNAAVE